MDKPFFSVIIPTLNEEKFVVRLLTDLTQQKNKDFEVIVVDGKSKDKTVSIVRSYQEKLPLMLIVTEKGVSRQRNRGARAAQGQFLVFLDADVQIPKNFLTQLRRKIGTFGGDVFTTYIKPDSRLMADRVIAQYINWGVALSILLEKPMVGGYNFIVSKPAFDSVGGFDEKIVHSEDVELSLRLNRKNFPATIFKTPILTFSLRRYREEGRLAVIRKLARAGIHYFTVGPITENIFSYPMGGGWYKNHRKQKLNTKIRQLANQYLKQFKKVLLEEVI